jgi:hypothetical protein
MVEVRSVGSRSQPEGTEMVVLYSSLVKSEAVAVA